MPAPEGDVTLGIAQITLPEREGTFVEIRIERDELEHAARLGAKATLTVVWNEAESDEKIVKLPVAFEAAGPATVRFAVGRGEVRRD